MGSEEDTERNGRRGACGRQGRGIQLRDLLLVLIGLASILLFATVYELGEKVAYQTAEQLVQENLQSMQQLSTQGFLVVQKLSKEGLHTLVEEVMCHPCDGDIQTNSSPSANSSPRPSPASTPTVAHLVGLCLPNASFSPPSCARFPPYPTPSSLLSPDNLPLHVHVSLCPPPPLPCYLIYPPSLPVAEIGATCCVASQELLCDFQVDHMYHYLTDTNDDDGHIQMLSGNIVTKEQAAAALAGEELLSPRSGKAVDEQFATVVQQEGGEEDQAGDGDEGAGGEEEGNDAKIELEEEVVEKLSSEAVEGEEGEDRALVDEADNEAEEDLEEDEAGMELERAKEVAIDEERQQQEARMDAQAQVEMGLEGLILPLSIHAR